MGISSKQKPQVSTIERNRRGDKKLNPGEQGDDVSLWRTGEDKFSKKFSSKGNLRESKPRKDWLVQWHLVLTRNAKVLFSYLDFHSKSPDNRGGLNSDCVCYVGTKRNQGTISSLFVNFRFRFGVAENCFLEGMGKACRCVKWHALTKLFYPLEKNGKS